MRWKEHKNVRRKKRRKKVGAERKVGAGGGGQTKNFLFLALSSILTFELYVASLPLLHQQLRATICARTTSCIDVIVNAFSCGSIVVDFTLIMDTASSATIGDIEDIVGTAQQDGELNIGQGLIISPGQSQVSGKIGRDDLTRGLMVGLGWSHHQISDRDWLSVLGNHKSQVRLGWMI